MTVLRKKLRRGYPKTGSAGILPAQHLIRTGALATELGVDKSTIWHWTLAGGPLHGCLFRRGYYSVAKLIASGALNPSIATGKKRGAA